MLIPVCCPHCQSDQVIKGGTTKAGKHRYKCQNPACPCYSFQLDLTYQGRSPEIKDQIIDLALNGSGIRDTARVLKISPTTVMNELKKESALSRVNQRLLDLLHPEEVEVVIRLAGETEAEANEMWSFVQRKHNQRRLWHAIDHHSGKVLAYVFGRRQDEAFLKLKALLGRLASRNTTQTIGVRIRVISIPMRTSRASVTPKRLSANT